MRMRCALLQARLEAYSHLKEVHDMMWGAHHKNLSCRNRRRRPLDELQCPSADGHGISAKAGSNQCSV